MNCISCQSPGYRPSGTQESQWLTIDSWKWRWQMVSRSCETSTCHNGLVQAGTTSAILTRTILIGWWGPLKQWLPVDIYVGGCRACCTSLALCSFLAQIPLWLIVVQRSFKNSLTKGWFWEQATVTTVELLATDKVEKRDSSFLPCGNRRSWSKHQPRCLNHSERCQSRRCGGTIWCRYLRVYKKCS